MGYYLKCDAVDCCKCDSDAPKEWDIQSGLFTKVNFVGYEDTTELNDNPVSGAEHWTQTTLLPKVLGVSYDYYLHREGEDVISHRIDYSTTANVSGSILMEVSKLLTTLMSTGSVLQSRINAKVIS